MSDLSQSDSERILILEKDVSGIKSDLTEIKSMLKSGSADQTSSKRYSTQLFLGVVVVALPMIAWWMDSNVKMATTPIRSDISKLEGMAIRNTSDISTLTNSLNQVANRSVQSETDRDDMRQDLHKTMDALANEVSSRRAGFSALQQQLTEAERQHTMGDHSRNTGFEHIHSLLGMLFEKAGLPKPNPPAYFPSIGRSIHTAIPND